MNLERRHLFSDGLSMDTLILLTGCDISKHDSLQRALVLVSRFNDRVQAALFGANRLASTSPDADAVKDFRYNAWYQPDKAPRLSVTDYRLSLPGRIDHKQPWTVEHLYTLPQVSQIMRHVFVKG